MDKTKLEHELDVSESKSAFSARNVLIILFIVIVLIETVMIIRMKETVSLQEEKIKALEKTVEFIQDDLNTFKKGDKE